MIKKRGYLCSPLSAPTTQGIEFNMTAAKIYKSLLEEQFSMDVKATHIYLPMLLDDNIPKERALALSFGLELLKICDVLFVCGNRISDGMYGEIKQATQQYIPIFCFDKIVHQTLTKNQIYSTLVNNDILSLGTEQIIERITD